MALKQDGTVWTWGANYHGQLGDGTKTDRSSPVKVLGLTGVVALAAGDKYSLAVMLDGKVWTWGSNFYGQLGDGTTTDRSSPVQVPGLTGVVAVAAGGGHSLALKSDGSVWAWGFNVLGQLGDGTRIARSSPVQVKGPNGIVAIAAGENHSIAVKSDGSSWAWGWNYAGQLGDGTTTDRLSPVQGPWLTGVRVVAAGQGNSFALKSEGSLSGWGNNNSGQLADGTFALRNFPVLVVNPSLDGFLNLITGTTTNVSPELTVPFFLAASGGISDTSASVSTAIKFNAADMGKSGAVFVTAMAPSGSLSVVQKALGKSKALQATIPAASAACSYVPVQLTSSGWQPVTNGQLIPYATGVLGDQLAAQTILSGTDTTNLKGAQFCLGYGASATEMTSSGNIRVVATIPTDSSASCPVAPDCTLPASFKTASLDCLFNWAEQSFPQYFRPTGVASATKAPYYYRVYPGTSTYLLASSADNEIWLYGSAFGGILASVGPIANFIGMAGCSQ
jgi:hypothetical protein